MGNRLRSTAHDNKPGGLSGHLTASGRSPGHLQHHTTHPANAWYPPHLRRTSSTLHYSSVQSSRLQMLLEYLVCRDVDLYQVLGAFSERF